MRYIKIMKYLISNSKIITKKTLLLTAVFLFISFPSPIQSSSEELSSSELAEIMLNPIARNEMQKFVQLFDAALEIVRYQNSLQFQIDGFAMELIQESITPEEFSKRLGLIKMKIYLEENKFSRVFSEVKRTTSSNLEIYYPLYSSSYELIEKTSAHAEDLSDSTTKLIEALLNENYEMYDQLSAKSYLLTADFLLITAESIELNRKQMPDFNLMKIVLELEVFGSRFLSDVTRLNAFYLQSDSIDPQSITKIHKGISSKYESYRKKSKAIKVKLIPFMNQMKETLSQVPELKNGQASVDDLDIFSINYIDSHNRLVVMYMDIADLYLAYKNNLNNIPGYKLDAINNKIAQMQDLNNKSITVLNNHLFKLQNDLAELSK